MSSHRVIELPSAGSAGLSPTPPGDEQQRRSWWGNAAELLVQAELARLLIDPVFYGRGVPRGDGGAVLLIPGFLAGDASLLVLADWLRRIGYTPCLSGIHCNVDCSDRTVDRLEARLRELHAEHGRVRIIGHSRGGQLARSLAVRCPDLIEAVWTLGSPLAEALDVSVPTRAAVSAVRAAHTLVGAPAAGCFTDTCTCRAVQEFAAPWPDEVPLVCLYTKTDGVVWWQACFTDYSEPVEVRGSHLGLCVNRHVFGQLARSLGRPRRSAHAPDVTLPLAA